MSGDCPEANFALAALILYIQHFAYSHITLQTVVSSNLARVRLILNPIPIPAEVMHRSTPNLVAVVALSRFATEFDTSHPTSPPRPGLSP
jgi:hypothetical protein